MKKIVIISIIVIIVLTIGLLIIKKIIDNSIMDKGNTTRFSKELLKIINTKVEHGKYHYIEYSSSGDSNGNLYTEEVNFIDKKYIVRNSPYHDVPINVKEYSVTDEDLNELINLIDDFNLVAFAGLEMGDVFADDAPSKKLTISCDNDDDIPEHFTISYDSKIPKDGYDCLRKITDKMSSFAKEENLTNSYDEKLQ